MFPQPVDAGGDDDAPQRPVEECGNHVVSMIKVAAAREDASTGKMRWQGAIGRCGRSFASPIFLRLRAREIPNGF
jgi:hypothetical protein